MNSKTVLNKIMTLLSAKEVELTYAKLADGTIVESPTFDVGEPLEIVSEDGTKSPAPDGEHELSLRDESGNENIIKVITKDGKIVERENVELEDVKTDEIPQAGETDKANEVPDAAGSVTSGTIKAAEETMPVEGLPEDEDKEEEESPEISIELGKMIEKMSYRIEELEKKIMKMEEMMPTDSEVVEEEDGIEMEEEELPKLNGAPVEEKTTKFSAETNAKNYGKKIVDAQSSFLSKLYK
jgi:translation initiation factor IF-2